MIHNKHKNTFILNIFFSICTISLLFVQPCVANTADDKNVVLVMGDSRIYTDVLAARSAAVSQCLLSAVEQTAIGMIPFTGLTEKFVSISDLISGQRNTFISDYKVLKEVKTEKHYRVLVQVTVSSLKLEEALATAGIILSPENLPKILFLIAEQQADDISPQYWWRKEKSFFQTDAAVSSMKKIFTEKRFSVISDEMIPFGLIEDLGLNAELTDAQAIEIGKRVNADLVIVGNAIAVEMSNRMGEHIMTFKATVTTKALLTVSGEQIARTMHNDTNVNRDIAAGSNQALTDAGFQTGIALTSQILPKWNERMTKTGEITLTVNGTDILPYLVVFRNKLKNIDGINSQQTLEMTPDEAILMIKYDGTSQSLADALLMKSFDSFSINIYESSENTLNIELISK
ncbi:MAG: hypothetical protein PF482_14175 [Desulfobacteraceae bacterium]|jgi:hypothetical protein|nr:hypothetical protein [Desulfobacteraceae bacterium]